MKNKILIIDNDEVTIQVISHLANALNLQSLVMHNWGKSLNFKDKEGLLAVFVNVELSFVDLQILLKDFPQNGDAEQKDKVAVYYLYSKSFNRLYQAAKKFPCAGELKKPIKGEALFDCLKDLIDLEEFIDYNEREYRDKLRDYKEYLTESLALIKKLETYFE